jgi:hypothetical protein
MPTTRLQELLRQLRDGVLDAADTEFLETTPANEVVLELSTIFPHRFQERHLRGKWEVGMARSIRHQLALPSTSQAMFGILRLIPFLGNCLLFSGERDTITGIASLDRLTIRPDRDLPNEVAVTSGRGFQIDLAPDGWTIKPLRKTTTKFTSAFLQRRVWLFDALTPFARSGKSGS